MNTLITVDDLGFEAPGFSESQIAAIAAELFGLSGDLKNLGGERDQNTRLTCADGSRYVLKISGASEACETVDFQAKALLHIADVDPHLAVPRLIPNVQGQHVSEFQHHDSSHQVRLLTYLPGIPWSHGPFPSETGLENVGQFLARLNQSLSGFRHPASTAFMAWDICNGLVLSDQFQAYMPESFRSLGDSLTERISKELYPAIPGLRKQVIHQDGHGGNVLRENDSSEVVTGIIDFGDMVYGPVISDVVICASHFMVKSADPISTAAAVCRGFSSVLPLQREETDQLLNLVMTRQLLSLLLHEYCVHEMPHREPDDPEESNKMMASLTRLFAIDSDQFAERMHKASQKELEEVHR